MQHRSRKTVRKAARRRKRKAKQKQRKARLTNRQELQRAIGRFVIPDMFTDLKQHGNTRWIHTLLLRTSLFWMISERRNWRRRFREVVRVCVTEDNNDQSLTFEGFLKAVHREYVVMTERLIARLREVMLDEIPPELRQVSGRDVFAVDGTSLELPRTLANQKFFCADGVDVEDESGSECAWKQTPQMHLTTLWHVNSALPWEWRAAPGDTSERHDLRAMVGSLPEQALVVADAGFVGYDLWEAVLAEHVDFVVRVGSNVHLIEGLEPTGDRDDWVSFWPHEARRAGQPPQTLRLVKTKLGKTDAYLVTNVLDRENLSDLDVAALYRARWGVEVFYRGLKQTFGRRRLKGRTPASALAELHLSMLTLCTLHLLGLLASSEIQQASPSLPPLSTTGLLDAVRDALSCPDLHPPERESLCQQLRVAHLDDYLREGSKRSRRYPRQNQQGKCGSPVIRGPKREEQTKLATLIRKGLYQPIAI